MYRKREIQPVNKDRYQKQQRDGVNTRKYQKNYTKIDRGQKAYCDWHTDVVYTIDIHSCTFMK